MNALVLSGGGNYGAMQAGALEEIVRAGYRPQLVVGNSAGALNAIQFGDSPTLDGVARLQQTWREVGRDQVGSVGLLRGLKQVLLRERSLFPSQPLAEFVADHLAPGVDTFGELQSKHGIHVYTVAARVHGDGPRVFGDRGQDRLLDGAMASTALPPYFPPWSADGEQYMDGGIYSNLPLRVAVDRGAKRILALWVRPPIKAMGPGDGILKVTGAAVTLMSRSMSQLEIDWARRAEVDLRVMELHPPVDIEFWDYEHAERLIEAGRTVAKQFLEQHGSLNGADRWRGLQRRLRGFMGLASEGGAGQQNVAE